MADLNRARKLYVSAGSKETAYDTAQTVDREMEWEQNSFPGLDIDVVTEQDLLGNNEEPTNQFLVAQRGSMAFSKPRVRPDDLAFCYAYAMGSISSALAGAATVTYKHEITPAAASAADMPSFTMEALIETGTQRKFSGGLVNDLALTANRGANRMVTLSGNMLFSGTDAAGSASPLALSEDPLNAGKQFAMWLGTDGYSGTVDDDLDHTTTDLSGSPTVLTVNPKSEQFTWNLTNNINPEDNYHLGGGDAMDTGRRQGKNQTLTIVFDAIDYIYGAGLTAQTTYDFQAKLRGSQSESGFYYGFNLILPKLQFISFRPVANAGIVQWQAEFQILEDDTYGSALLFVFNLQSAYMA